MTCLGRESPWRGIRFGKGKTAVRAGFGMYYTLIDNLSFLLNSLPPANGSVTFTGPLSNVPADHSGRSAAAGMRSRRSDALQHFRAAGHRRRRENADGQRMESDDRATDRLQHGRARRLRRARSDITGFLSVDPNTIPAQICSSPAGCAVDAGHQRECLRERNTSHCFRLRLRRQVRRVRILTWAPDSSGLRRQQQLQRAATRRDSAAEPTACSSAAITRGRRIST